MGAENNSDSKRTPRWILDIWKILRNWVVLPLLGALLGAMLIGRIIDWVIGPKTYKIYVVGNFEDGGAAASIWDGISKGGSLGKIDGIPVELEKGNDFGDPLSAQRISIDLASRNDLLAVVGHFASTQTKAALPAYLRTANPPIPVILTTETNPNLLPPKPRETIYDPVFRLSPTDDDQASKAAAFAIAATCTRLLGRGGYDQSGIFRFSGKEVQRTRSGEFKSGVAMDQQSEPPARPDDQHAERRLGLLRRYLAGCAHSGSSVKGHAWGAYRQCHPQRFERGPEAGSTRRRRCEWRVPHAPYAGGDVQRAYWLWRLWKRRFPAQPATT